MGPCAILDGLERAWVDDYVEGKTLSLGGDDRSYGRHITVAAIEGDGGDRGATQADDAGVETFNCLKAGGLSCCLSIVPVLAAMTVHNLCVCWPQNDAIHSVLLLASLLCLAVWWDRELAIAISQRQLGSR